MANKKLTRTDLIFWASPQLAYAITTAPVNAILPTLYSQFALVSLAASGTIFTVRIIFDAVSDQFIGYLSDKTRTRFGSRKPWIAGGAFVTVISIFYLFNIPSDAGVIYYGFWSLIYYLGFTMYNIPHTAWGGELSGDYGEKTKVFGYRGILDNIGGLIFPLIPIALFYMHISDTKEFTPESSSILGWGAIILIPLFTWGAIAKSPIGAVIETERTSFRGLLNSVKNNKPFIRFIIAFLFAGAGVGILSTLFYPFIVTFLKIGESFSYIFIAMVLSGIVSVPIWVKIVYWIGKHRAWAYGWIVNSISLLPLAFVNPGDSALIYAFICMMVYGFSNGVSLIAPYSILSDVIDYDILKTKVDRAGNYYAFQLLAVKMMASAGGLALIILGLIFGYEVTEGHVNTDFANMGMKWMFIAGPALLQLCAIPFIWNFPIDERRQKIIRRRIEQRSKRNSKVNNETSV